MAYEIGSLAFDVMRLVNFDLPKMQREIESKAGQDGVSVFNTGRRSREFVAETIYACASYADAAALEITYANYFGLSVQTLTVGTASYNTTLGVVVLGVSTMIESSIAFHCARGVIQPAFLVRASWRLQMVEI